MALVTTLRRVAFASLLWALFAPLPPARAGAQAGEGARVLLVSWDGAKPSVLRDLLDRGRLPNLRSLMESGAWTLEARVVGPTLTLPSHATMVTGLPASGHGITWNSLKPERGAVEVDTLFDLCRKAGLRSAMVYGKKKFAHLLRPGSPDGAVLEEGSPAAVARRATPFLRDPSYSLVMVHFATCDAAGHDYGWGDDRVGTPPSAEYVRALEACDAGLGRLVKVLRRHGWDRTLVLVTSDHGGHGDNHGTEDPQDQLVPWVAGGGLASPCGRMATPVRSIDTAPTVLEALGLPVPSALSGRPVIRRREPTDRAA